ncbi:hypothetical protein TcBrA4_0113020 [Trypanosoma cruzi]|nr:hypothetical protein TcBrA4_0113020 [Trypanosoma cruzi]
MKGCPGGKGRRAHRVTGAFRCGEDSIPGVDPDIGPRVAALRTGAMRLLPALRQACTRPADHKELSVSVAPSLPDCGDRPASASAGTSSRREHRKSLPTSERRIDVLLPNLRQSALVRPQYEGTCRTCSAWRYNSLRGPPMRMPQWRHRLLNRCLAHRSPPKLPSVPAGNTTAGTRDGPGSSATASSRTPRAADSTAEHGRLRLIHCGNVPSLGTGLRLCGTAPARTTEYLPLLYGRPLRYSLVIATSYKKSKMTTCL